MTTVSPSLTSTLALTSFLLMGGTPFRALAKSGASLVTFTSMMMRLSGVICGVTSSDSAASLKEVLVAPLELASW
ncbi:hypothetical protein D3C72_2385980 [compost metagenome]